MKQIGILSGGEEEEGGGQCYGLDDNDDDIGAFQILNSLSLTGRPSIPSWAQQLFSSLSVAHTLTSSTHAFYL